MITMKQYMKRLRKLADRIEAILDHCEIDHEELAEARQELNELWEEQFSGKRERKKTKRSK